MKAVPGTKCISTPLLLARTHLPDDEYFLWNLQNTGNNKLKKKKKITLRSGFLTVSRNINLLFTS